MKVHETSDICDFKSAYDVSIWIWFHIVYPVSWLGFYVLHVSFGRILRGVCPHLRPYRMRPPCLACTFFFHPVFCISYSIYVPHPGLIIAAPDSLQCISVNSCLFPHTKKLMSRPHIGGHPLAAGVLFFPSQSCSDCASKAPTPRVMP